MEKLIYINELGQSVEISHYSPFFLEKVEGLGAIKNIIHTQKSPFQDGETVIAENLETRDITIDGSINAIDKEDILGYRRRLLKIFNPKLNGKLQYELDDFKKEIECKVDYAPIFPHTDGKYKKFLLQLFCPNPFWRDLSTTKEEIAIWRGMLEFPLEILESGIEIGYREPSLIINAENKGDVPCGIKLDFKALGTVKNPSLLNINTREFIRINKTMTGGEVLTVTTHFGNKRVESNINGVITNAFNFIDLESDFIQLNPGDNLFRYDADEGLDNLEASIYYTPQYLGV